MPIVALRRPQAPPRERLRTAIGRVTEESNRLNGLEDGQRRAQERLRTARQTLEEAEAALRKLQQNSPTELAYAFANNELADQQALTETTTTIDHHRQEQDRLVGIDEALSNEIAQSQVRLRQRQRDLYSVMADVVITSDEYTSLLAEIDATWVRLRSLRVAAIQIQTGLRGYLPTEFERRTQAVEPLEERVGYPVDEDLVRPWAQALSRLSTDADTPLPDPYDEN
jgi:chromosome segregation ATPase